MFNVLKLYKYTAIAKINLQSRVAYMIDILSRIPLLTLRLWMLERLYFFAYRSVNDPSKFEGLDVTQIIWMLMIVLVLTSAAKPRVSDIISEEVKSGTLAYTLNRPYSYIFFQYFSFWGRMLPALFTSLTSGIIVVLVIVGPIHLSLPSLACALLLIFGGFTLDFLMRFSLGLLSFWIEDITAITAIWDRLSLVLTGWAIPIAVLPTPIKKIVELLPFSQLFYSSARLTVNFETSIFYRYFMTQIFWIFVMAALAFYIYKRGIKYVSINGG